MMVKERKRLQTPKEYWAAKRAEVGRKTKGMHEKRHRVLSALRSMVTPQPGASKRARGVAARVGGLFSGIGRAARRAPRRRRRHRRHRRRWR
jgi:hypothetical protein